MSNRHVVTSLPAAELGLTEEELLVLIGIEADLRSGALPHCEFITWDKPAPENQSFNMAHWSCGTVACLGGTLDLRCGYVGSRSFEIRADSLAILGNRGLYELFYPRAGEGYSASRWSHITAEEAADAILWFRTTGRPQWTFSDD